ncbi:sedoheptulokinase isoform X2 [Hypanus sabinus]|uniref:sedoheptulokinase isoform X2 n=1 Tax=Hypanus sabinus TaxID=79690 RepID=UPI0028C4CDB1|nr:sedoheptulokinase isoform X2 [Hypanus sabinus]
MTHRTLPRPLPGQSPAGPVSAVSSRIPTDALKMSVHGLGPWYVLGVDIGTTSVKVVLLEAESHAVVDSQTQETRAALSSPEGQQDVGKIVSALHCCVMALPRERLGRVARIGVSGQMHGVVLWNEEGCKWQEVEAGFTFQPGETSHLVTWQDGRCHNDFLASLPQPDSHLTLASGFGCATLFWYTRNRHQFLQNFTAAGTIQDYVVAALCGLRKPLMSAQNAASWGYFNTRCGTWNLQILTESGFPTRLLPDIMESGSVAGKTICEWCCVPEGTDVGVALGDLQCSVYCCMANKTDAVLNISTSAQLCFALPPNFQPPDCPNTTSSVAYFPYLDGMYLAVAAALNGGNVLSSFVSMLKQWMQEFGLDVPDPTIYSQAINSALSVAHTDLVVEATVFGERHLPGRLGCVTNISPCNLSLGHVIRALCRGVVNNLHSMLPVQWLAESGVRRIVGSGSALARNPVLKQELEKIFTLPIVYREMADSAVGVAMVMLDRV